MSSGEWDPSKYYSWPSDSSAWGTLRSIGVMDWGVHLTKHQHDPQADDMSCWPAVVPLLITRTLLGWGGGIKGPTGGVVGVRGHWGLHMTNEDGLLQSSLENARQSIADNKTWAQVNGAQVWTTLGHEMPLQGCTSDLRSVWPKGWPNVKLTWCSTDLGQ